MFNAGVVLVFIATVPSPPLGERARVRGFSIFDLFVIWCVKPLIRPPATFSPEGEKDG